MRAGGLFKDASLFPFDDTFFPFFQAFFLGFQEFLPGRTGGDGARRGNHAGWCFRPRGSGLILFFGMGHRGLDGQNVFRALDKNQEKRGDQQFESQTEQDDYFQTQPDRPAT
jgi:hypothetical protein